MTAKPISVNRFVENFVRTLDFTASWTECGDADNKGLAKAGGQWLIERLCLLFILVLGDSEVLFMPAFAKPRTVTGNFMSAVLT